MHAEENDPGDLLASAVLIGSDRQLAENDQISRA